MHSQRVLKIYNINLAAFLATAGHEPSIYSRPFSRRVVFEFIETDNLHEAIIEYERGAALPAKKLLNARNWLFREASRAVREAA